MGSWQTALNWTMFSWRSCNNNVASLAKASTKPAKDESSFFTTTSTDSRAFWEYLVLNTVPNEPCSITSCVPRSSHLKCGSPVLEIAFLQSTRIKIVGWVIKTPCLFYFRRIKFHYIIENEERGTGNGERGIGESRNRGTGNGESLKGGISKRGISKKGNL